MRGAGDGRGSLPPSALRSSPRCLAVCPVCKNPAVPAFRARPQVSQGLGGVAFSGLAEWGWAFLWLQGPGLERLPFVPRPSFSCVHSPGQGNQVPRSARSSRADGFSLGVAGRGKPGAGTMAVLRPCCLWGCLETL